MTIELSLVLGLGFGALAAMAAFAIDFESYLRQQFPAARIWRESLLTAGFAFLVFFTLAMAVGYALRWVY